MAKTSDLIFVSTDELLEIQAPTLSNVVHIGGLGLSSEGGGLDEVSRIFQTFLKASYIQKFVKIMEKGKGVILFSLGTIANTTNLPPTIMENLMKITQKFKDYEFIIKVDKFDRVRKFL